VFELTMVCVAERDQIVEVVSTTGGSWELVVCMRPVAFVPDVAPIYLAGVIVALASFRFPKR
jgi:hypothetical protein